MIQDKVIGTQFLLDAHDMQLMKDTVARRKDKAVLAGVAGLRKPLIKKKFQKKKFGDRNGRGRGGDNRNEESQSRERGNKGDDGKDEASQGRFSGNPRRTNKPGGFLWSIARLSHATWAFGAGFSGGEFTPPWALEFRVVQMAPANSTPILQYNASQ